MRKIAILMVFLFSIGFIQAQNNTDIIEKGAVLTLGTQNASGYQHIDFPRKNLIIKRGAIANFNVLKGEKVVVSEVLSKNGSTKITLERKNGSNFFRFWRTVDADLEEALANGELILPKLKGEESLAKP